MCMELLLYILLQINGGAIVNQETITIAHDNGSYTLTVYQTAGDPTPSYSKVLTSLELEQSIHTGFIRRENKLTIGNDQITVGNMVCGQDLPSEVSKKLDKCLVGLKLGLVKELHVDNSAGTLSCKH